jgi:glutamyl-tRNA synthetase
MVRVRFAPSPTGYLHVGGARTALFNWLYARRHGGAFVLRIEDTDAERSSWEMVSGIVDGLRWLGLDWDEGPDVGGRHGPYFQSQRLEKYRAMAARLVADGHAYYCYCNPDTLKRRRDEAQARGDAWRYDRTCCALPPERIAELEATGAPRAIRFKLPDGVTRFDDLVHGTITFDHADIEDFVVLRSDLQPTYHLCVVVDDIDMEITHVVRGDDHISNTPKQVLLYQAFGRPVPAFAHVPLILGPDKKRLSKRHGATSVTEYRRLGYLPEAMVNFLALLGWSPGDDREVLTRDELIAAFTLEGISGGNAVFNPEKLDWFNSEHITRMPAAEIVRRIEPELRDAGLWREELATMRRAWLHAIVDLVKPRLKRLSDIIDQASPFLRDAVEPDPAAAAKYLSSAHLAPHLTALRERLARVDPFEPAPIEAALREVAAARGVTAASLIHATRVAVTGQSVSPGLFEVLALVGRERVLDRLAVAGRRVMSSSSA